MSLRSMAPGSSLIGETACVHGNGFMEAIACHGGDTLLFDPQNSSSRNWMIHDASKKPWGYALGSTPTAANPSSIVKHPDGLVG